MTTRTIGKTIQRSWMDINGLRLDGGPYLSGAFEARVALERLQAKKEPLYQVTLRGREGIFNGPRFPRSYVEDPEYGVPFLGSIDILAADFTNLSLLSKKQVGNYPELLIDEGWTLITCSGTIGRMAFARPDMKGMAGSQHFLRVVPNPECILPGYLYAYLSSRYGVPLVISGTYGGVIEHIEPQHIVDLPVPRLGVDLEQRVHALMREAAQLRAACQRQVEQATEMFFHSVGLKDITAAEWHAQGPDLGFSWRHNPVTSLRAANYNPRFLRLCEDIKAKRWKTLAQLCLPGTLQRAGRYKRIDADREHGCQLIGQRQLFWQRPEGRWVAGFALGEDVFVEAGTILVAARGTLGEGELYCRSEFVWATGVSYAYSEDMLRVVADEKVILRGCLFAFFRSEMAFRMLRSISSGSKMQDNHYALLPALPIPWPEKDVQQDIHALVVDAYEKRHRSNTLEDQAVELIEHAIQEGG
jgi:hypothetical protein